MNNNAAHFAAHVKARTIHPPRLLYKYTSMSIARKIIDNETLRFSSPLQFNDPLDTQWNMLWQLSTPEFHRALVERILGPSYDMSRVRTNKMRNFVEKARATFAALPPGEREQYLKDQIKSLDLDITLRQHASDQLNWLRVFCLGSTPDSMQMWSYYADQHEGVVLAFDSVMLENAWQIPAQKVEYVVKPPNVLDPNKYPDAYLDAYAYGEPEPQLDFDHASKLWPCTKAHGWEHEQEWRFVFIAHGDSTLLSDQRFPIRALHGIALGCKGKKKVFDELAGLLLAKNANATIWLTNPHRIEFALVATPIDTSRWLR